tara:strand:+ start:236 stop:916 length:681 start_codon:yes stop_codon:yes gene_type:complete
MNRLIFLFAFIGSLSYSQQFDFQALCLQCAQQEGFYCGDDPSNWTQYSPNGCVQTDWINDGWEDCVDAADENAEGPTLPTDCLPPIPIGCDTVFIDIPVIEYITEYITEYDTIVEYETVIEYETVVETQYIYVTDTVYADVLDTMYIDVVEYVDVIVTDTVTEIEYVEVVSTEYVDCETGMPCGSGIEEVLDKSKGSGLLYNLQGQAIRKPEDIYIENGKIKYVIK